MVLHRPFEPAAETGQVDSSQNHLYGNPTTQELAASRPCPGRLLAVGTTQLCYLQKQEDLHGKFNRRLAARGRPSPFHLQTSEFGRIFPASRQEVNHAFHESGT